MFERLENLPGSTAGVPVFEHLTTIFPENRGPERERRVANRVFLMPVSSAGTTCPGLALGARLVREGPDTPGPSRL